jgi:hypothetical protein
LKEGQTTQWPEERAQKDKNSLKIPKEISEAVIEKRTDNTMTRRKRTRGHEQFEDTEGVIRSCKSKKDRQHNGQKKEDKRTRKV